MTTRVCWVPRLLKSVRIGTPGSLSPVTSTNSISAVPSELPEVASATRSVMFQSQSRADLVARRRRAAGRRDLEGPVEGRIETRELPRRVAIEFAATGQQRVAKGADIGPGSRNTQGADQGLVVVYFDRGGGIAHGGEISRNAAGAVVDMADDGAGAVPGLDPDHAARPVAQVDADTVTCPRKSTCFASGLPKMVPEKLASVEAIDTAAPEEVGD
jgi:hypothetical protein